MDFVFPSFLFLLSKALFSYSNLSIYHAWTSFILKYFSNIYFFSIWSKFFTLITNKPYYLFINIILEQKPQQ